MSPHDDKRLAGSQVLNKEASGSERPSDLFGGGVSLPRDAILPPSFPFSHA